ncbi:hypothetical protein CTI14_02310 [Methylobacterium radiotolerans]|nr:hypothetical protein CTI14_02310 [Methylobacterium radiotolerans]
MTPQQARSIHVMQGALAILLVLNLVAEFRSAEWDDRNGGLTGFLWTLFLLSLNYRIRLETGRWQPALLVWVGLSLLFALIDWLR